MIVGVPKEIKPDEYRVAVVPAGVEQLKRAGHTILIQRGAGLGSGIRDEDYQALGAAIIDTGEEVFGEAELICKVKEPLPAEIEMLSERPLLTVLLTTHDIAQAERLCDRAALLRTGRIEAIGSPRELAGHGRHSRIEFMVQGLLPATLDWNEILGLGTPIITCIRSMENGQLHFNPELILAVPVTVMPGTVGQPDPTIGVICAGSAVARSRVVRILWKDSIRTA